MPLPDLPWSTSYPTSQDTPGTEQPDLTADSIPGAEDGHRILVSHFHSIRDKLQSVATKLGDGSNLPAGSVGAKVSALESAPPSHASSHQHSGSDEIATATPAANAIPKAGAGGDLDGGWITYGTSATTACEGNDSRLSDARTPTSHASTHEPGGGDAMTVDAAAATGSLRTLGTGAQQACAGNDSRLSDSRTPTSHASSHQNGGSDEVATATPAANAIPKAGAGGDLDGGWITYGSSASTACEGNDSRLSDSRTPTSHASSHQDGGSDEVATATPAASAIPKADGSGKLDSWISDSGASTKGLIQLAEDLGGTAAAPTIEGLGGDPLPSDVSNGFLKRNSANDAWEEAAYGSSANTVCEGNDSRLSDARTPTAHNLGGSEHSADTLANLNSKVSDATLIDEDSTRHIRDTTRIFVSGTISTGTEQGGVWEAPAAGAITRVTAYRKSTTGTSGSTIIDVNIGGTTIFTTQSNRPTIVYNDGDGKDTQTTIEAGTLAQGDLVTVDVDQIDTGGSPTDLTVVITIEYSA